MSLLKDCGFHTGGPLFLSLGSLALEEASCHVVRQPCVKVHVARDEGLQEAHEQA